MVIRTEFEIGLGWATDRRGRNGGIMNSGRISRGKKKGCVGSVVWDGHKSQGVECRTLGEEQFLSFTKGEKKIYHGVKCNLEP